MRQRPASVASTRRRSRPSTAMSGDWVHTARSMRTLQTQVQRNTPVLTQLLSEMDEDHSGVVSAEDFVVALVDAGVEVGSQQELMQLAGGYSSGNGPTAKVRWKQFMNTVGNRTDQNLKQANLV